ncbi:hypothetical protein E2320_017300, partial [Naja naja]
EIRQLIEQLKPNNTPVGDLIPSEIFNNNIDYWGPVFSMSIIEKLEIYGLSNEAIQGQDTFRQKRSLKERIFLH